MNGLRFVVPVRTYRQPGAIAEVLRFKRGITWLNAVNDQVAGIGQMAVPGIPRVFLHILDALRTWTGAKSEVVATGHASYSDMVFDDRARNRVNLNKVITHWPDMLKVASSLVTNQVRAHDLLRMFGRDGRLTPLGAAFAEYGRVAKTEHPLRVVDPVDDTYRRQMNRQLTVQESRHKPARDVCHGKRGTIHQAHRNGTEDQLGALGLVLNAIVLWTTKYIDAADALRPLRAPDAPKLDEDDDGRE
ncbi:transposase [Streptomyces sp. WAC 06783]|uniref:transposase n=1 Tax=Streptomyces sp. WAC 06783 TaxID=2203211 RepID=UPI0021AD7349|nr:transposase [Streptomyces sp. WAC 06783]